MSQETTGNTYNLVYPPNKSLKSIHIYFALLFLIEGDSVGLFLNFYVILSSLFLLDNYFDPIQFCFHIKCYILCFILFVRSQKTIFY